MVMKMIFLALMFVVSPCVLSQQFTCPATSNAPNAPSFMQLPATFNVLIEFNNIEKGYTVTAQEYTDNVMNRTSLYTSFNGSTQVTVYNFYTREVYFVMDNDCTVYPMKKKLHTLLVDNGVNLNNVSVIQHMYRTTDMLLFTEDFGRTYMGQGTTRSVNTDHWQTCMYWPGIQSNFTMDVFISRSQWNTPDGTKQVPVRIEVQGIKIGTKNQPGKVVNFHHIYDYINFQAVLSDPGKLEVPPRVVCPGRKMVRKLPQLQSQYRYREEIISRLDQTVTEADVWYDYSYRLVRYDYRYAPGTPPYYTGDAITEIHDYHSGIAYAIDQMLQNCTIMPIQNSTWDSYTNTTQMYLHMRNPRELFFLDASYQYAGQRKVRQVDCDVFVAKRTDITLPGIGRVPTVITFFFMTDFWTNANSVGVNEDSTDVPMRMEIYVPSFDIVIDYEFYNFDEEHPSLLKNFDISSCFSDADKVFFRLTFPAASGTDFMNGYKILFLDYTLMAIAKAAQVPPLRIQQLQSYWDRDFIYVTGTMLEKAPSIAKYTYSATTVPLRQGDDLISGIYDPRSCADKCDQEPNFVCNSFDYCGAQGFCSLSKNYVSDGQIKDNTVQCVHYSRVLGGNPDVEMSLFDAWLLFRNTVYKGGFILNFQTPDGQTRIYKATEVTDKIKVDVRRQPVSKLSHFTGQTNKDLKGFHDIIINLESVDDCAYQCEGEVTFTCQAFEYCYSTSQCILSRVHPDDRPDLVQSSQTCDLYTRDYTAKYTKTPGTTVLSSSDAIYQAMYSDNQCAKLCNDYNDFPCKSFDYCPDINTCFLGRQHIFDIPKANIQQNPTCSHYSRSYIDDFMRKSNKIISLRDDRIVVGVSPDQCAKMCVEEETFQCASFDYCANSTECRLSTADMRNVGQVSLEANAFCDVYQRQYFPNGQQFIGNTAPSTGYSSGSMAGLAIGMIVLGILLGLACIFAFTKFRGGHSDGMNISFTNKEHLPE